MNPLKNLFPLMICIFLCFFLPLSAETDVSLSTKISNKSSVKRIQQKTVETSQLQSQWQKLQIGQIKVGEDTGWFDTNAYSLETLGSSCWGPSGATCSCYDPPSVKSQSATFRMVLSGVSLTDWNSKCTASYSHQDYETRPIYENSYSYRLELFFESIINPNKASISFTSDHFIFKDAHGTIFYFHPSIYQVRNNSMILDVPIENKSGNVIAYPKIYYQVTEFK